MKSAVEEKKIQKTADTKYIEKLPHVSKVIYYLQIFMHYSQMHVVVVVVVVHVDGVRLYL
jgi:hypothetical protein